ncbi:MAG: WYL domain-containing protein [Planctomycetes bacterium]|nr:WYL domain-containing protein [Planctomycetota bacterium]
MSDVASLISLASFLATHPKISVEEAALATHRTAKKLMEDMRALLMVGTPPFSPSDYIGYAPMTAGKHSQIQIYYADHFRRPPNFTPQEALALKFALDHFAQAQDAGSRREISALSAALADMLNIRAAKELTAKSRGFVQPGLAERMRERMAQLTRAAEERRVVELEYYSAHRGALSVRRVHPYWIVESGAHFYVFAHCELAGETRHFRLDRVRALTVLNEPFSARPPKSPDAGRMKPVFSGTAREQLIVEFSKEASQDVADEWRDTPGAIVKSTRGKTRLCLPLFNDNWAVGFVLSFGRHARVLKPARLRETVRATIVKALKAHGA